MSDIPFRKGDGEVPLWATERKQLPSGEWVITIWLSTNDTSLSHKIHKMIANLVTVEMNNSKD